MRVSCASCSNSLVLNDEEIVFLDLSLLVVKVEVAKGLFWTMWFCSDWVLISFSLVVFDELGRDGLKSE